MLVKYATGTCPQTSVCVGEGNTRGNCIAMVHMGGPGAICSTAADIEANARLIAAVPDLADALLNMDLSCQNDVLNPCWNGRPTDVAGKHWGGGTACANCRGRAALAKAGL